MCPLSSVLSLQGEEAQRVLLPRGEGMKGRVLSEALLMGSLISAFPKGFCYSNKLANWLK